MAFINNHKHLSVTSKKISSRRPLINELTKSSLANRLSDEIVVRMSRGTLRQFPLITILKELSPYHQIWLGQTA